MTVTERFKSLATASGRHVSCRIELGDVTYTDDNIIKLDFADMAHPDWFTIGTTCSNELSFTVVNLTKPEVHDEVRAYISFDEEEWVPLGIFYIARRYFRGKYATFVCYDRMYDLDVELQHEFPPLTFTNAKELLDIVCAEAGLEFNGSCVDYAILNPKKPVTLRQLLGYIAALHCGIAKINRYGALVFKTYSEMPTEQLSANNCIRETRNITRAGVRGIRVNTGREILRYKEHNEGLSMIDLYNPFMRQDLVDAIGMQLDRLYFYGAEIEMQGLPFLEAGDFILLEDADGSLNPIVMSEIQYHYNGALTAKLYSRNKEDSDTVVRKQEFEDAIAALWDYVSDSDTVVHRSEFADAINSLWEYVTQK